MNNQLLTIDNKLNIVYKPLVEIESINEDKQRVRLKYPIDGFFSWIISAIKKDKRFSPYQVGDFIEVDCEDCEGNGKAFNN